MLSMSAVQRFILVTLIALASAPTVRGQDTLEASQNWSDLVAKGFSLVLGRFEGQFDGPLFKSKKIRLQTTDSNKTYYLPIQDGLGYFEVVLPPGVYRVTGLEANYAPIMRPLNVRNYRPIHQKFGVKGETTGESPAFHVRGDRPVYVGTILADTSSDGIVYQGRLLRVRDEFGDTLERFQRQYPRMAASLIKAGASPSRQFFLKPTPPTSDLELIGTEDPIRKAREYIADGKYQTAVNWLTTFMPSSELERNQSRLLIGEALLADQKYEDAIEKLGAVLLADPENVRALRLLARAHALTGNQDDALSLFQALNLAKPVDAEALLQIGYIFALRAEPGRSAEAFNSAFKSDQEYLLHDPLPFAVALHSIKDKSALFEPARLVRSTSPPPPSNLRSRRGAVDTGMSLVIDHTGRVVAARIAPNASGPEPFMVVSAIRGVFKPAQLNGVPVPSLLTFGGTGPTPSK